MSLLAVGILIPAGPGQLGNFQYAVAVAVFIQLPADQLDPGRSVFIFLMYVLMQGFTALAGVISLMTSHVSLVRAVSGGGDGADGAGDEEEAP